MEDYTNSWEGKLDHSRVFNLKVEIEHLSSENAAFRISNNRILVDYSFQPKNDPIIKIPFTENQFFEGIVSDDGNEINGFIKSGMLLYHLDLVKSTNNIFEGVWKILMVDELKSQDFYLSVENGLGNDYEAYPILGDNRFTGTWCQNFQKENDLISFTDFKTGLLFKGKLLPDEIKLDIYLGVSSITQLVLKKSTTDWKIGGFKSDNKSSLIVLSEMEAQISNGSFGNTHSILISKNGEIVYENYFDGYNSNIPHDTRSASKSISSAIVGIAKDQSLFKDVDQSIFNFLPQKYQTYKDSLKSEIDIQSLLTMSSGLDAIDYGVNANQNSPAVEDNFQHPINDWTTSILSASMLGSPNTKANYGSANPYLLGVAMDSIVPLPLEMYMDKYLFQKLEISNYIIQTDIEDRPYFGGGMYLTPRDLLKFGELYLQNGKWKKEQVVSKKWVESSFKNFRVLENTEDKNGYGYLWWHHTYQVHGKEIKTIEARGAGGQYIFVVPDLKTVVVITSGNFRNNKTQQPETIIGKYILPKLTY